MAIGIKNKVVRNVGALKKFLENLPDSLPIYGSFDDRKEAFVWKADRAESGPRKWLSFEDAE